MEEENLAYVIYTSGSTGRAEGSDGGAPWPDQLPVVGERELWRRERRSECRHRCRFDATVTSLLTPLVSGGRVILVEEGREREGLKRR